MSATTNATTVQSAVAAQTTTPTPVNTSTTTVSTVALQQIAAGAAAAPLSRDALFAKIIQSKSKIASECFSSASFDGWAELSFLPLEDFVKLSLITLLLKMHQGGSFEGNSHPLTQTVFSVIDSAKWLEQDLKALTAAFEQLAKQLQLSKTDQEQQARWINAIAALAALCRDPARARTAIQQPPHAHSKQHAFDCIKETIHKFSQLIASLQKAQTKELEEMPYISELLNRDVEEFLPTPSSRQSSSLNKQVKDCVLNIFVNPLKSYRRLHFHLQDLITTLNASFDHVSAQKEASDCIDKLIAFRKSFNANTQKKVEEVLEDLFFTERWILLTGQRSPSVERTRAFAKTCFDSLHDCYKNFFSSFRSQLINHESRNSELELPSIVEGITAIPFINFLTLQGLTTVIGSALNATEPTVKFKRKYSEVLTCMINKSGPASSIFQIQRQALLKFGEECKKAVYTTTLRMRPSFKNSRVISMDLLLPIFNGIDAALTKVWDESFNLPGRLTSASFNDALCKSLDSCAEAVQKRQGGPKVFADLENQVYSPLMQTTQEATLDEIGDIFDNSIRQCTRKIDAAGDAFSKFIHQAIGLCNLANSGVHIVTSHLFSTLALCREHLPADAATAKVIDANDLWLQIIDQPDCPSQIAKSKEAAAVSPAITLPAPPPPQPMPPLTPEMAPTTAHAYLRQFNHSLAQIHRINLVSAPRATQRLDNEAIALHQQQYANDFIAWTKEMLDQCPDPYENCLLAANFTFWRHIAIEQAMSAALFKRSVRIPITHRLDTLSSALQLTHKMRDEDGTLPMRYPSSFDISYSSMATSDSATRVVIEAFKKGAGVTLQTALQAQYEVLEKDVGAEPLAAIEALLKQGIPQSTLSTEVLPQLNSTEQLESMRGVIQATLKQLQEPMQKIEAASKSQHRTFANVYLHLRSLRRLLGLVIRFPQHRFLCHHAHTALFLTQYLAENLGAHLSQLQGGEMRTHNLEAYRYCYGLGEGLSPALLTVFENLNVKKGSEYPYYYFAENGTSPIMQYLSNLYASSKSYGIVAETHAKEMSLEEIHRELINSCLKPLTDLAVALVQQHLL